MTKSIIPVHNRFIDGKESRRTVSARDLHEYLVVGKVFGAWIKERIEQYDFVEGEDYILTVSKTGKRKNVTKNEYFISLDMAKELSMVQRNEKGKKARKYFIECEKRYLKELKQKAKQLPAIQAKPVHQILTTYPDGTIDVKPMTLDNVRAIFDKDKLLLVTKEQLLSFSNKAKRAIGRIEFAYTGNQQVHNDFLNEVLASNNGDNLELDAPVK